MRDALREHLHKLNVQAREARDRDGYKRGTQADPESLAWEGEAAWPEE